MMRRAFTVVLAMLAFSHAPAAAIPPVYNFVSGYAETAPIAGQRYYLAASDEKATDSLEFRSHAKHIEKVLAVKQLVRVASPAEAEILIIVDYGIGPPQKEVGSYSLPTFGQTGVASSSTYGTVGSYGTVNATTTYTPSFGITGSTTQVYSYTTYDRWMRLSAFAQQNGSPREVWRTEVKSTGSTGDLRTIFPFMAFASQPYVGLDTGKAIKVKVKERSKEFKAFLSQ